MRGVNALAALGIGSLLALGGNSAFAQTIPGQVAQGQPGWECTTYRFIPGQQWVCGQWSFVGERKLTPPPGFVNTAAMTGKAETAAKAETPAPQKAKRKKSHKKRHH